MRLKTLEIFGFKSFPHRTRVDFGPGVSAIVGPNGCGKSNVCDAIRWALGEQSAKTLRGGVMEDLIFNGTADTPAQSLAEVTLTFAGCELGDGASGELVVSRRMYRSGESQYYVNNRPVRLRDVRALFADTGLGKSSYAVIEQGTISLIVQAKAEDRRVIFEEAAGIFGYRAKRAEALAKLDDVQTNMDRVEDLYQEYQRRARSLKRQAGAARRYQGLVDRHRFLDVALNKIQYDALAARKEELLKRRDGVAEAYQEARARLTTLTAEVARLDAEAAALEMGLAQKDAAHIAKQRAYQEAEATRRIAEARLGAVRDDLARLRAEQARREEEIAAAVQQGEGLAAALQETAARQADLEAQLELLTEAADNVAQRERERVRELEAARGEHFGMIEERTRLANKRAVLAAARESLERDLRRLGAELEQAALLFDEKSASRREAEEELLRLEEEYRACVAAIDQQAASDANLAAELGEAEQAVTAAEARRENVKSRLDFLRELAARFESFGDGVAALMAHGAPPGIVGVLADVVRVREGYERAVERALGQAAAGLLAADMATAVRYGDQLAENGQGRAAFIVGQEGVTAEGDLPVEAGVRGWASDFVSFASPLGEAVAAQLRDVVVVDDLQALERVASVYRGLKITTLRGDWWDGRGLLVAGAADAASYTIFGRRAEMDRLAAQLAEAQEDAAAKRSYVADLKAEREALARRRQENAAREAKLAEARINLKGLLDRAAKEGGDLARRQEVLAAEWEEAQTRYNDLNRDAALWEQEEAAAEEACLAAAAKVAAAEEAAAAARQAYEDTALRVAGVNGELAGLREKRRGLEAEAAHLDRTRCAAAEARDRCEAEAASREAELAEITAALEDYERQARLLLQEAATAEEAAKEARLLLEEKRAGRRDADGARAEGEKAVEEISEQLREQEVAAAAIEGELNALEERLLAKYNVRLSCLTPGEFALAEDVAAAGAERDELGERLARMGDINFLAAKEYDELAAQIAELEAQRDDLAAARANLRESIARIDEQSRAAFLATFEQVREEFKKTFQTIFGGGQADLKLQSGADPLEAGVQIYAQPPGKKMENLTLLSGGEKALTAIALIFALFNVRPSPFAILDEVDAPLDDNNINRFINLLEQYRRRVQFIVITHARRTMQGADAIYGVTMERKGISKVISLKLEEVPEEYLELEEVKG